MISNWSINSWSEFILPVAAFLEESTHKLFIYSWDMKMNTLRYEYSGMEYIILMCFYYPIKLNKHRRPS